MPAFQVSQQKPRIGRHGQSYGQEGEVTTWTELARTACLRFNLPTGFGDRTMLPGFFR